jgi:agmatinase
MAGRSQSRGEGIVSKGRIVRAVTQGLNFGGMHKTVKREDATVCIIPLPYDSTTTLSPGARRGPAAIIEASKGLEMYDSELGMDPSKRGIFTHDAILPNLNSPYENSQAIESVVAKVVRAGKLPVCLGGDHSVTLGAFRAVHAKHRDIGFLVFDAHPDLFDEFEGSKYGHANVTRRVHDLGAPIALAGIRNAGREEVEYIKKRSVPVVGPREMIRSADAIDRVLAILPERIYLSIDIDVFDPSLMPATGTPEPGGLQWYDMMDVLTRVAAQKTIVAFDLVELCPIPGNPAPDFVACKLVYRLIGMTAK